MDPGRLDTAVGGTLGGEPLDLGYPLHQGGLWDREALGWGGHTRGSVPGPAPVIMVDGVAGFVAGGAPDLLHCLDHLSNQGGKSW